MGADDLRPAPAVQTRSVVPLPQMGKGLSAGHVIPPRSPHHSPFNVPFSSFSFEHVVLERASDQAGLSDSVASAGIKRERHQSNRQPMFSSTSMSAELDAPSAYRDKSRESSEHASGIFGGIWNSWVNRNAEEEEDDDGRAGKKRKGMAGVILSTAIEAAVFTGAVGYAAYQLWKSRGTQPDNSTDQVNPPPPPYTPQDPTISTHAPHGRKVTHVHAARQRHGRGRPPSGHHSSSHQYIDRAIDQVDGALAQTASEWGTNMSLPHSSTQYISKEPTHTWSPSSLALNSNTSYFMPMASTRAEQQHQEAAEKAEVEEEDPTMAAFEARIQALISTGQAALASRPSLSTIPRSQTNESLTSSEKSAIHTPLGTPTLSSKRWNQDSPSGIPRLAQIRRNTTTTTSATLNSSAGSVGSSSRLVTSPEVQQLSKALEVTAKGTGKRWCD